MIFLVEVFEGTNYVATVILGGLTVFLVMIDICLAVNIKKLLTGSFFGCLFGCCCFLNYFSFVFKNTFSDI